LLGVGALVAPLKFQYVVTDQSSHAVVARIDPPKGAVSALQFLNDLSFAVALRENGVDNLWVYPIAGGPGRQVTHFKSDYIFEFHFSPDAKNIALARGRTDSDIVLIRDVKQK
jgi:tricorn protease-like protein